MSKEVRESVKAMTDLEQAIYFDHNALGTDCGCASTININDPNNLYNHQRRLKISNGYIKWQISSDHRRWIRYRKRSRSTFVQRGAKVVITGRREAKLQETCNAISGDITYFTGDVTDDEHRKAMIGKAVVYGGKLDALISNAGNMYRCDVAEFEEQKLIEVFHSNVIGMMLVKEAFEHLKESKGCVVFVGSVHTQRAFPNASPYAATKGALKL